MFFIQPPSTVSSTCETASRQLHHETKCYTGCLRVDHSIFQCQQLKFHLVNLSRPFCVLVIQIQRNFTTLLFERRPDCPDPDCD
jgi:hypothetical protein